MTNPLSASAFRPHRDRYHAGYLNGKVDYGAGAGERNSRLSKTASLAAVIATAVGGSSRNEESPSTIGRPTSSPSLRGRPIVNSSRSRGSGVEDRRRRGSAASGIGGVGDRRRRGSAASGIGGVGDWQTAPVETRETPTPVVVSP
jgi:hypothetical protein